MFLTVLMLLPNVAAAEETEADLYYNDDRHTLIVYVTYEKDDLKVSFKDPDDNAVSLDSANVEHVSFDGGMIITIKDAAEGQWKLVYDKGSNESIKVDVQRYENPVQITELETKIDGDELKVDFLVTHDEPRDYNYEIRLGTDPDMVSYRVLESGYGSTGEKVSNTISLENINSHDGYYIQVFAYYDKDGNRYFDQAVSDKFSYSSGNAPDPIDDFDVTVEAKLRLLEISVEDHVNWNDKTANITVSADGKEIFNDFIDLSVQKDATISFDSGVKLIKCSVTVQNGSGLISSPATKEINLAPSGNNFLITLPEGNTVSGNTFSFSYENADDQAVYYTVNDKNGELKLNGNGEAEIELPDQQNTLQISYTDSQNVKYIYDKLISIDNNPPALVIYEQLNGMTTEKDSVIITGKTDTDCVLTVDGQTKVELADNGTFSYEYKLKDGENVISFSSEDSAGNTSLYSLKINKGRLKKEAEEKTIVKNKTANKIFSKIPLIVGITIALFVILELLVLIFGKLRKKSAAGILKAMAVILFIFATAALVFDCIYFAQRRSYEKSADYIDLAVNDSKAASEYLDTTAAAKTLIYVFSGLIVLSVLMFFISVLIKRRNDPALKAAREKKKAEAEAAKKAAKRAAEEQARAKAEAERLAKEQAKRATAEAEKAANQAAEAAAKPKAPVTTPKFCMGCGSPLTPGAKFCTKCGKKLQ